MIQSETLKAITADELHTVIDADISATEDGAGDSENLLRWALGEYPELIRLHMKS